jgi:Spy/CpxP family protein refolding chaperone
MKLLFPLLVLLTSTAAGLATIAAAADLQEQPAPTPPETESVGRSANDVLNMLSQRLSLSDDQRSKILPILEERRQKIREVLADATSSRRQKMGQMAGILEDSDKRINALLSLEQQKTYAVVEQEVKAQMKARHSRTATTAN